MGPLLAGFTAPTARPALVRVTGAVLAPARRTVAAARRAAGCGPAPDFTRDHHVLNRNRWSPRHVAQRLLLRRVQAFTPEGPVVIDIDATLERRWGATITARGIDRDPVRSSHGHVVKASGLRWLCVMLLPPIPWPGRVWALPFRTVLAPSGRYAQHHRRRPKTLTDWARQALLRVARGRPDRRIIAVAYSRSAAIDRLNAVRHRLCAVARRRLDARLFDPPPRRRPSARRRSPFAEPVGAAGEPPHALAPPAGDRLVLRRFVRRWCTQVTFAAVRRHRGVETQRQWSDPASRTPPPPCSACSRSSRSGPISIAPQTSSRHGKQAGIRSRCRPSLTRWRQCAANDGRARFPAPPRTHQIPSKCRVPC
jgi:hypothetical protein